jgi:hypothetical protein
MHAPVGAQLASIWEKPSILRMKFKCLITIAKDTKDYLFHARWFWKNALEKLIILEKKE